MGELIQEILALYNQRSDWFLGLLWDHFLLSGQAILLSGSIGLVLGIFIAQRPKLAPAVMGVCNVLYTIPAISLLGILIPFTGIGNKTAVIALTIYGVMPMVRNTYVGLTTLDPDILEAATGMGSTNMQALFRVKLPMAAGVILAGVRNMVVMTVSVAGIASFVGAGGLGVSIYRGITILFVTHDIEEALKLGTRVLVMEDGKATQFDPPSNLMASPATPFVAQLVRRSRDFAPRQ